MPLICFVETQALDVATVGRHVVQRVSWTDATASQIATATFAGEGDTSVGQPTGIEVVPGAVGQLFESGAVDVHFEHVVATTFVPMPLGRVGVMPVPRVASVFDIGKQNGASIEREVRGKERAAAVVLAVAIATAVKRNGWRNVVGPT